MTPEDENPGAASDTSPRSENDSAASRTSGNARGAGSRAKRSNRAPAVNAIQATRRHRKERGAMLLSSRAVRRPRIQTTIRGPPPAAGPPAGNADRRESDPWTVPDSVRNRFVQDGNRFFFPDGAPAFKDLGRRLTTTSENTQVVHSLIQIAHSRGWSEITVSGTERFRQEAWRQARIAGLAVRGYRPTELEQAQLIRGMARNLSTPASSRTDTISADPSPTESRAPSAPAAQAPFAMGAGEYRAGHPEGALPAHSWITDVTLTGTILKRRPPTS